MAKFRVHATCASFVYLDVEAETEADAREIAENADGGEFTDTPYGDWSIDCVERID